MIVHGGERRSALASGVLVVLALSAFAVAHRCSAGPPPADGSRLRIAFEGGTWEGNNGASVEGHATGDSEVRIEFLDSAAKDQRATYAPRQGSLDVSAAAARAGDLVFEANSSVPNPLLWLGIGSAKGSAQLPLGDRIYSLDDRLDTWEEVRIPLEDVAARTNGEMDWAAIRSLTFRIPKTATKEITGGVLTKQQEAFTLRLRNVRFEAATEAAPRVVDYTGNLMRQNSSFEAGPDWVFLRDAILPGQAPNRLRFDASTSVHGKTSLCVERTDATPHVLTQLFMCPFRARKGRTLVVSAYLKCDQPSATATIHVMGPGWGWVGKEEKKRSWSFPITDKWQRVHFSVELTGRKYGSFPYRGVHYIHFACGARKFWIDAVQIEEEELTDYEPGSALDVGLELDAKRNAYFTGEPVKLTYRLFNHSAENTFSLNVAVEDFWGRQVFAGKMPIQMRPGTGLAADMPILPTPPHVGWYRVRASLEGKDVREEETRIFSVLRRFPAGIDPESTFHATHPSGIVTSQGGWFMKGKNPEAYPCLITGGGAYGSIRGYLTFVHDTGFAFIRGHGAANYHWKAVERSQSEYTIHDHIGNALSDLGMGHMVTLGNANAWGVKNYSMGPEWHTTEETTTGGWFSMKVADPEAYAAYFAAVVKHFKGRLKYYHVINEPDSGMDAKTYLRYLKAAYTAAKEVDRDCKIVGIGGTSDFGWEKLRFFRECLDLGAADYLDVIAIHYADCTSQPGPEAYRQGPPGWQTIPAIQKMVKEKTGGRDIPIWDTEISEPHIGSALGIPNPFGREIPADRPRSENAYDVMWAARSALLDYCHGVQRRFQFVFDQGANADLAYQRGTGMTYYDGTPTAVLSAYNAQAHLFLDSKPVNAFRTGPHDWVWCCVIRKGEGYLYALWCGDNKKRTLRLQLPPTAIVLDIFGGPKELVSRSEIPVGGFVTYILSKNDLSTAVRLAKVE
jgi:hypothetical protein